MNVVVDDDDELMHMWLVVSQHSDASGASGNGISRSRQQYQTAQCSQRDFAFVKRLNKSGSII